MLLLSEKNYTKEVVETKDAVLVDFYANWCGPCQMLSPVLEDISKDVDFKNRLRFAKLDTESCPELAEQNSVQGIPCLIIFKNGKEVQRIVGYAPKPVMKAKIMSILESIKK